MERTSDKIIWMADMRRCLPAENISQKRHKGCWKAISYKTKKGPKGYLIYALYQTKAKPVRLPLGHKGKYDIYVGIWNSSLTGESHIRLKLSHDPCYRVIFDKSDAHCLTDYFFKRARLDKQDLWMSPVNTPYQRIAALAYVRLEPVVDKEKKKPVAVKYPLIGTEDGFSAIASRGLKSKEDLWEDIENYRDTDFKKIFYCIGGADLTPYPTKNCTVISSKTDDFASSSDFIFAESVKEFIRQKLNPLKCCSDYARKMGLEFQLYQRMQSFAMDPPFEETFSSDFFWGNPQWRCVAKDGRKTNQMSYAFPEVRKHILDVISASFSLSNAAGINLAFVRGGPCVLYEKPVLDTFKKETGLNAGRLKIDNERFLKFKAEYVTQFIRETRGLLEKINRAGKKKELSVHVYCDRKSNLMNGFDVESWADRKLVDLMVVWPQAVNMQDHYNKGKVGYLAKADYRYFHRICRRNKIPMYLCILTAVTKNTGELIGMVQDAYRNGVDGLVFWDPVPHAFEPGMRQVIRRMGDKDWVMSLTPKKFAKHRTFPLKELGGFMMDKYWSWIGF